MNTTLSTRNIGLDLIRVTETAALAAGHWLGSGDHRAAHRAATRAMASALDTLDMDGRIVIGEERQMNGRSLLASGQKVGNGDGPEVDLAVDPIDGTNLLIKGRPGAISVVGITPRGTLWSPGPAAYMEKIIVGQEAASALVRECLDAPAAWTLALIARVKSKAVRDLTVVVLDRPRNEPLIQEVRNTGAHILLKDEGDAEGALVTLSPGTGVDILMGIGGAQQGVLAACAVKAMNGGMLARLAPQTAEERHEVEAAGLDAKKIMTCSELVRTDEIFFAATGITDSALLPAMRFSSNVAETYSLLIRSETGTRRFIHAEHGMRVKP
ncbi:MAG: class II fructose-bisphosphatase [Chloroflexi bacterium]|nr:class II fructose-bisphosphatase [Chloroflexota bacterium]